LSKIFIKNIENIQGDESDIIIFSANIAQKHNGDYPKNFGSINKKHGENRLNVAFSRARKKIYFVKSVKYHEIENTLKEGSYRGMFIFKEYVKFIENMTDKPMNFDYYENSLGAFDLNINKKQKIENKFDDQFNLFQEIFS
jgi:superfamily I DNA and/or RNA helicase